MTMPALTIQSSPPYAHVTVMATEVVQALAPRAGGIYVDVTLGGGGHSLALLTACPEARVFGFDRDPAALDAARARLQGLGACIEQATFDGIESALVAHGITQVDGLVADLGLSSAQLDDPGRGMSFRADGPIDMRMDPSSGETALELIARTSQDELADIIFQLGEERRSRRVARCIKQAFDSGELATTADLRRAVVRAVGPRRVGGIDPATRTFQALRMAVNAELDQLSVLLETATRIVTPGGAVAIISFHSLEDRMVKYALRDSELWERAGKKPLVASDAEQAENPRSRSAKLRAARRLPDGNDGQDEETAP